MGILQNKIEQKKSKVQERLIKVKKLESLITNTKNINYKKNETLTRLITFEELNNTRQKIEIEINEKKVNIKKHLKKKKHLDDIENKLLEDKSLKQTSIYQK